jgi:hypothetical protein
MEAIRQFALNVDRQIIQILTGENVNTDLTKHYRNEDATRIVIRDFMQDAIDCGDTVWVKYRDKDGEVTERDFRPQECQVTATGVRVVGMCLLRQEVRSLLSSGILEIARKPVVRYRQGQVIEVRDDGYSKGIIAQVSPWKFCVIGLEDGNRWCDPIDFGHGRTVSGFTEDEVKKMTAGRSIRPAA